MVHEINNTVPADDQMKNAAETSFLGNEDAPFKILILGNSITRHGKKAELGWDGDYGMAASCAEKDYVHQLFTRLTESGKDVYMRIRQASYWETHFAHEDCLDRLKGERDFGADVVIFRLGENVKKSDVPFFCAASEKLLGYVAAKNSKILVTTCFWKSEARDQEIKRLALKNGYALVDIGCENEEHMALGLFEHQGVAMHPGDTGMAFIADQIFEKLQDGRQ